MFVISVQIGVKLEPDKFGYVGISQADGQALTKPSRAKIRSKRFPIQNMLGLCYTFST